MQPIKAFVSAVVMLGLSCLASSSIAQVKLGRSETSTTLGEMGGTLKAPSHLSIRPLSPSSALIQWQDNSNDEQGFEIQRLEGIGGYKALTIVKSNQTRFIANGLTPGKRYCFRVRAVSDGKLSPTATLALRQKWNCVMTPMPSLRINRGE